MPTDTETAYAKINLALHVRRRCKDGYHDIETLFAFAQHGDQLQASLSDTLSLTIDGPFGSGLCRGHPRNVKSQRTRHAQQKSQD